MRSNVSSHIFCILTGLLLVLFSIGRLAAQDAPDPTIERISGTSNTITGLTGVEYKVAVRSVSSIGARNWSSNGIGTPD